MRGPEFQRKPPEFSEEENKAIGEVAIEVANAGEEAIFDIKRMKMNIAGQIISMGPDELNTPGALAALKLLKHEVDVMDEVVRRATAILQMEGRGPQSRFEKDRIRVAFGYEGDLEGG